VTLCPVADAFRPERVYKVTLRSMPDPALIERIGETALVVKILGPTADYIGEGVQQWTQRASENVHRIFENAADKLGPSLEHEGAVPPRVLKGILEEGQFCDDELGAEYLGGVLASSRTSVARDDRGASLVALVSRLSTYQLRAHYVMYSTARRALVGAELNLGMDTERRAKPLFLPYSGLPVALDLTDEEIRDFAALLTHVVSGLVREELIEDEFSYGPAEHISTINPRKDFGDGGLIYRVRPLGVELYCAAHGVRGNPLGRFIDPDVEFRIASPVAIGESFGLVADLPELVEPALDAGSNQDADL
jgi:hypothetical protein